MKNTTIKIIVTLVLIFGGLLITNGVQASGLEVLKGSVLEGVPCAGGGNISNSSNYPSAANCTPCDFVRIFVNLSNMIIGFSATIALLMFVLAGVMMIASYINPKWVNQAKDTMKYTIIGLGLIFASYTIINTVIAILYGGKSDFGAVNSVYSNVTGKDSWGVCIDQSAQ